MIINYIIPEADAGGIAPQEVGSVNVDLPGLLATDKVTYAFGYSEQGFNFVLPFRVTITAPGIGTIDFFNYGPSLDVFRGQLYITATIIAR